MLTNRGWWFFLASLTLAAVGLALEVGTVALLGLTLLGWFLGQWLMFAIRIRISITSLYIERELSDGHGPLKALWARVPASVHISLHSRRRISIPFVSMIDRVPTLAERRAGDFFAEGALATDAPLQAIYQIECLAPGRLRFEGVKVRFADLQGFFVQQTFVRRVQVYRVLPPLTLLRGHIPAVKRFNRIPMMGHHPHRRPGSGSELLDLRDYVPGDPPRMIAWKASARRRRLMTKELESEVPVRCTLFLDISNSVRLGPAGATPLARMVEIAATVAHGNITARDLTGLCLFDDQGIHNLVRPGRGPAHVAQLTNLLADSAGLAAQSAAVPLDRLLPLAYGVLQDMYPDWLDNEINAVPLRIFFARRHRWRKRVAAVLSVHFGLGPGGLAILLENDLRCSEFIQRFLNEHQVPCPLPLYDEKGHYVFGSPRKLDVLAQALLRAVLRGRDNELFVLFVDFLDSGPRLDTILRAVRVAMGRHHQVMVICPWPPGVELPGVRQDSHRPRTPDATSSLQAILNQASTLKIHQTFSQVRQAFGRLGVPVICARAEESASLVLQRMQRLRSLQRGLR